jgi:hypothetical protein
MKSDNLIVAFDAYLDKIAPFNPSRVEPTDPMAILFGTDEFELDRLKGAVRLPGLSWVACPGLVGSTEQPDWVAIVTDDSGSSIILGFGDPYVIGRESGLPTLVNGQISAVPHLLRSADRAL